MVMATEAGLPVNVQFQRLQHFDARARVFVDLPNATVAPVGQGAYVVTLNIDPSRSATAKIFRFSVLHQDTVDHFGEIVFHLNQTSHQG